MRNLETQTLQAIVMNTLDQLKLKRAKPNFPKNVRQSVAKEIEDNLPPSERIAFLLTILNIIFHQPTVSPLAICIISQLLAVRFIRKNQSENALHCWSLAKKYAGIGGDLESQDYAAKKMKPLEKRLKENNQETGKTVTIQNGWIYWSHTPYKTLPAHRNTAWENISPSKQTYYQMQSTF